MRVLLLRCTLGAIFLAASLEKIADPSAFAYAIWHYRLLPPALVPTVALILPWLEALAGGCLIVGAGVEGAALVTVSLSAIFCVATTTALIRGLNIACGCFTNQGRGLSWTHLGFDLALLLASLLLLWTAPDGLVDRLSHRQSRQGSQDRRPGIEGAGPG